MTHTMKMLGVLAGLCLLAIAAPAAGLSLGIADASGSTGSTVDVPVTVQEAQNIGALDIGIMYDPEVLSVVSVEKGSLVRGMFVSNTGTPGILTLGMIDTQGMTGSGPVAVVRFRVTGAARTESPLEFLEVLAYDLTSHDPLAMTQNGGTFTVTAEAAPAGGTIPGFDALAALGALGVIGAICLAGRGRRG